jgi:hypothetical protein
MIELIQFTLRKKNPAVRGGRGSDLPEDIFEQCALLWPRFVTRNAFKFEGERSSTELVEILEFLQLNGYKANWKRFPKVGYRETNRFQLHGKRVVEKVDIDAAELLVAVPRNEIAESARHLDSGELLIDSKSLVCGEHFGRASGSFYMLCKEEIRNLLEHEQLKSMAMEKVQTSRGGDHIFKIGSSVEMPPLSSDVFDLEGKPYSLESEACQVSDLFTPPLISYDSELIETVGDFDISFTNELFGDGRRASWEPKTIVSQRFRAIVLILSDQ